MSPPFTPDSRNVGGRNLIATQIWNHLQQLKEISQQIPNILISPRKLPHSPKQNSIEPVQRVQSRKKQDYLLYPTYLFRRKTVSESLTPSLSPKPRGGDETQLLFQEPIIRRCQKQSKQQQKIFPFSTIQLGALYKIKANDIKLTNKQNDQIPWEDVSSQLLELEMEYQCLLQGLQKIIDDYFVYSTADYQQLIKILTKLRPEIPKMDLINLFNELIIKQSQTLLDY